MYLGVKAVIAISMERIHTANLINFGIIPLFFENSADCSRIDENDSISIDSVANQLCSGSKITAKVTKADGKTFGLFLKHSLNSENIETIIAGGILNQK